MRYVKRCRVKQTTTLISSWRWCDRAAARATGRSVTSVAFAAARREPKRARRKLQLRIDERDALRDNRLDTSYMSGKIIQKLNAE